ncbi:MAG: hypothetical protein HYX68_04875 [Planctomycetes bacterium]|nr:hypothetical protein [Planctomycetota bacterium]
MRQLLVDDEGYLSDFDGPRDLSDPRRLSLPAGNDGTPVNSLDWFGPINPHIPDCPPPKKAPASKGRQPDPKVDSGEKQTTSPSVEQVGDGTSPLAHPFGAALRVTSHILELNPRSPLRPVDYRRQIALLRLTSPNQAPPEWVDHSTLSAKRFLRALMKCQDNVSVCELARKWPVTTDAAAIYCSARPRQRWELEARILARQPFAEIEARMAMRPGTVARYEQLFFSVLDRIACPGYIHHHVIRLEEHTGEADLGAIWRHYGYHGGPLVLDAIIYGSGDGVKPAEVTDVGDFTKKSIELTTAVKALIAILTMPINEKTGPKILKFHLQYLKLAARLSGRSGGQVFELPSDYSRNLEACFSQFRGRPVGPLDALVGKLPPPFAIVEPKTETKGKWEG